MGKTYLPALAVLALVIAAAWIPWSRSDEDASLTGAGELIDGGPSVDSDSRQATAPRRSVWHAPLAAEVAAPEPTSTEARRSFSGRLTGPRGEPIRGGELRLRVLGVANDANEGRPEIARTDAEGRFTMSRPRGRSALLAVRAPGYTRPPERSVRPQEEGPIEIELCASPWVWGFVHGAESGQSLADARVEMVGGVLGEPGSNARLIRGDDAARRLGVPPGAGLWALVDLEGVATRVRASAPGHAMTEFDLVELEAGQGHRADLALAREVPLRGRVLSATGEGLAAALVTLDWQEGGEGDRRNEAAEGALLAGGLGGLDPVFGTVVGRPSTPREVQTDAEGHYRVGGLGPGRWRLRATHDSYLPSSQVVLDLEIGQAPLPPDLRLAQAGEISGRVVDLNGQAVAGARIAVIQPTAQLEEPVMPFGDAVELAVTTADSEGRYRISGLAPGMVTVECESTAGAARVVAVRVEAGRPTLVDLEIRRF